MTTLYKFLGPNGEAIHGGTGKWRLPKDDRPGRWMPRLGGALVPCVNGYHVCRADGLLPWIGVTLYTAETRGDTIEGKFGDETYTKIVARQARLLRPVHGWGEPLFLLLAADCIERVLYAFEQAYPLDKHPHQAIETARAFARGEVDAEARVQAGIDLRPTGELFADTDLHTWITIKHAALINIHGDDSTARHYNAATVANCASDLTRRFAHHDLRAILWDCAAVASHRDNDDGTTERQWQAKRLAWYVETAEAKERLQEDWVSWKQSVQ